MNAKLLALFNQSKPYLTLALVALFSFVTGTCSAVDGVFAEKGKHIINIEGCNVAIESETTRKAPTIELNKEDEKKCTIRVVNTSDIESIDFIYDMFDTMTE